MALEDIISLSAVTLTATSLLLYIVIGAVYRLYLSPIAKFPGPKLAALTLWYEFYYDVVKRGRYTWKIREMHEKYGPIVRINPYELHIDEPDYYDILYSGPSQKRDKWEWSAKMFNNPLSVNAAVPHNLHRTRRAALNPYFSNQSVARLEGMLKAAVENLCARFEGIRDSGHPVNLGDAYAALTMDVITEYSFGKAWGCLATPDFAPHWPKVMESGMASTHLFKQFGWLLPTIKMLPSFIVDFLNPGTRKLIAYHNDLRVQVQNIKDGKHEGDQNATHPTVFYELLNSSLSDEEKSVARLAEEGQTIVSAGQITTAHYLKTTTFHILANPQILKSLKRELAVAIPDAGTLASFQQLEQLPYFSAVVNEGFRMSYGISHRLQRVSPEAPLRFRQWIIPAGTPVGMTSIFMHDNPDKFPDPTVFKPERWLKDGSDERLDRYLVNFSRGTRACLGMNLARAEIFLTLAAVFRRFDMKLYETTRDDVDTVHDFFSPYPRTDSKGVRVLF